VRGTGRLWGRVTGISTNGGVGTCAVCLVAACDCCRRLSLIEGPCNRQRAAAESAFVEQIHCSDGVVAVFVCDDAFAVGFVRGRSVVMRFKRNFAPTHLFKYRFNVVLPRVPV
jgi:hypothetical protein